jgi:hypothetical protein
MKLKTTLVAQIIDANAVFFIAKRSSTKPKINASKDIIALMLSKLNRKATISKFNNGAKSVPSTYASLA